MIERVDGADEIDRLVARHLRFAGVEGTYPTPLGELVAAARLTEPPESILGKSLIARVPGRLGKRLKQFAGSVRGLLDWRTREIHIDPEILDAKARFTRAHEIAHALLPWHDSQLWIDDDVTLAPAVEDLFERQASHGGSMLLFQGRHFVEVAGAYKTGLAAVIDAAQLFGGSLRAALRRYGETHDDEVAAIVLGKRSGSLMPVAFPRREAVCSPAFRRRFGSVRLPEWLKVTQFPFVAEAAASVYRPNQIFEGEWSITDVNGESVDLRVELIHTTYNVLVLAWIHRKQRRRLSIRLAPAAS